MQKRHSWVFAMVDGESDSNEYSLSRVFPGMSKEEAVQKVKQVKAWLQSLPLAKRPLVKVSLQVLMHPCMSFCACTVFLSFVA